MPTVTLNDCARCLAIKVCDAHGGKGWPHRKGIAPCQVTIYDPIHDPCAGCEKSDCIGCPTYNFLSGLDPSTGKE
jgi:hypothetical protein